MLIVFTCKWTWILEYYENADIFICIMYVASQHWHSINFPPKIYPLFESEEVWICFLIEYSTHNCSIIKMISQRFWQSYIIPGNVLQI